MHMIPEQSLNVRAPREAGGALADSRQGLTLSSPIDHFGYKTKLAKKSVRAI